MSDITITYPAQNEGSILDIRTYRKGRRCPHCHCPLSIYNPGPGCHAHENLLRKNEQADREEKEEENNRRSVAKALIKARAKKLGRAKK